MALSWPVKDPEEVLDFPINWSNWLVSGATLNTNAGQCTLEIESATGPGAPSSLVIDSLVVSSSTMVAWLSGGVVGTTYTLKATARDNSNPVRKGVRRVRIEIKTK